MNTSTRVDAVAKAHTLVEALPYIRSYNGRSVVVKIGGAALDEPDLANVVAEDLALLAFVGIKLIVVHGGGPQISTAMHEAGIRPTFVDGLRVTDDESIDVVRKVLLGSVNSDLVARLCRAGVKAVGLSGLDADLIEARRASGPTGEELGRVGRVASIRVDLLTSLLQQGYTPAVAPLAAGPDGGMVNVNADAVAGSVAAAVGATKLVYMTNVEGLYGDLGDAGSLISELKCDELADMTTTLSEGMRPKAESAIVALDAGVGKVHILDGRVRHALLLEIFTDEGIGTQVLP